ncbi:Aste57867_24854 [Aphanomyces stellatus]|uniref:Aste57867_24854 protein n=1 Tax=Aphanomyces stellatus TaxID=120398 RepID=A0A485LTN1_9STRA|nr:hypothetical protein As57867_024776 [Aphanomyces stellatus]VFU01488.1 Aste57867_24854 [Aphanomyces stellatus]
MVDALSKMQTSMVKVEQCRRPSIATVELTRYFHRPIRILAFVKHLTSSLCFAIMSILYFTMRQGDIRALQAYAPTFMGLVMTGFATLHLYGLVSTCRLGTKDRPYFVSRLLSQFGLLLPLSKMTPSSQIILFHLVDVVCQSYQAYRVAEYLVDRTSAFSFVCFVSLNCFITPWFFLSNHEFVQLSIVPFIQSLLGFILSTVFQFYLALGPALFYSLSQSHQNDTKLNMHLVLVSRWLLISLPQDFVTKVVIQLSSYTSLRQMVYAIRIPVVVASQRSSTSRVSEYFQVECHPFHRRRIVYAVCASIWGCILIINSALANWHRESCPAVCIFQFAPWWSPTCQCAYVEINCALFNTSAMHSIDNYLLPSLLGTRVSTIAIQRCALSNGIPLATLAPFQRLYGLYVLFSNITQWPNNDPNITSLPDSLGSIRLRYSNLTAVPAILATVPANLIYLRLEGAPISTIPDIYFKAWTNVASISLNELQLTDIPMALTARSRPLEWLELRGNRIRRIPSAWQPDLSHLEILDLSTNLLEDGPWHLVKSSVTLELSSNPIPSVPSSLDPTLLKKRTIVLDETPYCSSPTAILDSCRPKCSPLCQTEMIGDGKCDWPCFSALCEYDGGDCDLLGFLS